MLTSGMHSKIFRFNFPEFLVGTAEYDDGPTGCTAFLFPNGALAAVDVRGGAAALRESTLLDPMAEGGEIDALVLSGGSTYGLEAASGVMERLLKQRNQSVAYKDIPSVPGAVVYDFAGRNNSRYPDKELGARAFDAALKNEVRIGEAGAGAFVTVGKYLGREFSERSGQGAAFLDRDGVKIFALSVVNSVGNILDWDGRILAGSLVAKDEKRLSIREVLLNPELRPNRAGKKDLGDESGIPGGNTTISIVITNAQLDRSDMQRIAVMAHTAMARVIEPFHTPSDGDALFVVSTGGQALPKELKVGDLGVVSGALLQEAVMEAVRK